MNNKKIDDLNYLSSYNLKQKIIFILGTGRSGTHWLGYILENHPLIKATIEKKSIFRLVVKIALDSSKKEKLYPKLIKKYKNQLDKYPNFHYLDKSHPNIWIAQDLLKTFPNAKFVGIIRNPYATISSMFLHKGVMSWIKNWNRYPIPNKFLGITEENSKFYDDFSLTKKCMLRWISHYNQMKFLQSHLNSSILVLSYEDLITIGYEPLKKIEKFLDLEIPLTIKKVKQESLNKWKKNLTDVQINEITEMLKSVNLNEFILTN